MTTTHTPGPWRAEVASDGYDILSSASGISATVAITCARPHSRTGQADANLIAAAPELLHALTMVRDADDDCRRDGLATMPLSARSCIEAAIAKAEGR